MWQVVIEDYLPFTDKVQKNEKHLLTDSVKLAWKEVYCEWEQRMLDDICGLDAGRLQLKEKMQHKCKGTSLFMKFQNIGLEVVL